MLFEVEMMSKCNGNISPSDIKLGHNQAICIRKLTFYHVAYNAHMPSKNISSYVYIDFHFFYFRRYTT
jgi:hypothetical protein